ncbi:hypothetical protein TNCV_3163321 [Trichonephila clavipes]|nr:hypothetical protein TNCV_3163321 [Trichonephila clavipes]
MSRKNKDWFISLVPCPTAVVTNNVIMGGLNHFDKLRENIQLEDAAGTGGGEYFTSSLLVALGRQEALFAYPRVLAILWMEKDTVMIIRWVKTLRQVMWFHSTNDKVKRYHLNEMTVSSESNYYTSL